MSIIRREICRLYSARPLLLSAVLLSAAISPATFAQTAKPQTNGGALSYVGPTTRIGIGVDSDRNARGELSQVFGESDTSAWVGDVYGGRDGIGLKLTRGWVDGDWRTTASDKLTVTKVFAAVDQNRDDHRKLTLGVGREKQAIFWDAYLSRALSSKRSAGDISRTTVETINGLDGDRPFTQNITTVTRSQTFARAYEWGIGGRLGHFFEQSLLRLTAGLDFDFGKNSNKQSTFSIGLEKFFEGSPFSVAVSAETYRKSGAQSNLANLGNRNDFGDNRSDSRGLVMLRWDLGGNTFRPTRQTKTVQVPRTVTETVTDPAPAAAPGTPGASGAGSTAAGQMKVERVQKTVRRDVKLTEGFPFGAATLTSEQIAQLKSLAADIKTSTCPIQVNVEGHACPYGPEKGNQIVSERRANMVRDILIKEGIAADSIKAVGLGGKNPAYAQADPRNRRVDVEAVGGVCSVTTEEVKTPVAAPAPQPVTRQVTRTVMDTKEEDVPVEPGWLRRALHTSPTHKQTVSTYSTVDTTVTKTEGPRTFTNRCPVLVDDAVNAAATGSTTIDVLANDSDPDRNTLTLQSVTTPANGTATISGNRVVYTPRAGFTGADSFTYTVSDGTCTRTATARVTVAAAPPAGAAPICNPDFINVSGIIPTTGLDVLSNDVTSAPPLRIISVTQPDLPGSTLVLNANGTLTFTPPGPFPYARFTYTARDAAGGTCTGNVTLIDP